MCYHIDMEDSTPSAQQPKEEKRPDAAPKIRISGQYLYDEDKTTIQAEARTNLGAVYNQIMLSAKATEAVDLLADAIFITISAHQTRAHSKHPGIKARHLHSSSMIITESILRSISGVVTKINTAIIEKSNGADGLDLESISNEWLSAEVNYRLNTYETRLSVMTPVEFRRREQQIDRNFVNVNGLSVDYIGAVSSYSESIASGTDADVAKRLLMAKVEPLKSRIPRAEQRARENLFHIYWRVAIDADQSKIDLAKVKACASYRKILTVAAQMKRLMPDMSLLTNDLAPTTVANAIINIERKIKEIKQELGNGNNDVTLGELLSPGPGQRDVNARAADILKEKSFLEDVEHLEDVLTRYYIMMRNNPHFSQYAYKPSPIISKDNTGVIVHGLPLKTWVDKMKNTDDEMVHLLIESKTKYDRGIDRARNRLLNLGALIYQATQLGGGAVMGKAFVDAMPEDKKNIILALYTLKITVDKLRLLKSTPAYQTADNRLASIRQQKADEEAIRLQEEVVTLSAAQGVDPLEKLSKSGTPALSGANNDDTQ